MPRILSHHLPLLAILLPSLLCAAETQPAPIPAITPVPRPDRANWTQTHERYVALAKKGNIDLYFLGDSITALWNSRGKDVWKKEFAGWNPGNFGIGGDHTQHVLWRIENGELDGVHPKAIVLMIGTNNHADPVPNIVAGVTAIVDTLKEKEPQTKILLLAIFPRGAEPNNPDRVKLNQVNTEIAKLADGKQVVFLNIGAKFLQPDGTLTKEMSPDLLHPSPQGYQIWADAIKPQLTEWLGPPKQPGPATIP